MRTRLGVVAAVALSALALAGCDKNAVSGVPQPGSNASAAVDGKNPADTSKQNTPAADPKALISNAAKSSRDSGSYKFEWKMQAADNGQSLEAWSSTGEIDLKNNRSKMESALGAGGQKVTISIITDGTTMYMRTVMEGAPAQPWSKMDAKDLEGALGSLGGGAGGESKAAEGPGKDPLSFIDLIKQYTNVTPDGTDTVRGVATTRYNVTIDPSKIGDLGLTKDAAGGKAPDMKLWTDGQGRLAKFQMSLAREATMNAEFFDYDSPVNIQVPAASEVKTGN
jgi:predicted small secreted protein